MAKQFDNLYETMLSFEYLHKAFKKAAKGKRGNEAVASFEWNLESNLPSSHRSSVGTYTLRMVTSVIFLEISSSKAYFV